ncbi:hypothetical protein TNCV_4465221 [Trichonephila clavipes]|nr:hypothetical protein TNCV_4465221 [Trichonephila clavipes]
MDTLPWPSLDTSSMIVRTQLEAEFVAKHHTSPFRTTEKYHPVELSAKRGRSSRLLERHFVDYRPSTEKKTNPTRSRILCCSNRSSKGKKVRGEARF